MAQPPQEQASVDFFISYTSVDHSWAQWIAWQLEDAGYSTSIQAWDFRPGNNFVELMDRSTTMSDQTISVLSPDYLRSGFTRAEWQTAFAQDPTGEQGKLLPIRVRECDPVGLLSLNVYIDLLDLDANDAKAVLLAGVQTGRSKPPDAPGFPGPAPRFPGTLPPVWNVPYLRNPHFTGREELLTALRQGLIDSEATVLTQAISGLGGVGKTQLALEYIYRHTSDYALVWWVRAENALLTDYAQLAHTLNLPERDAQEAHVVVDAVRRWLAGHRNWLLVFDNVSRPEDVEPYLQQGRTGHMLITSRHQDWRARANEMPVNIFTREESLAYLRRRTGQDDDETAEALAEELGDLPLALSQAAAYLTATGTMMRDYLPLLRERRFELWGEEDAPPDYPKPVGTTWSFGMEEMARELPEAAELMQLMAFLAPEPVARDWLLEGAQYLPRRLRQMVRDSLSWNQILQMCRRYGVVEVTEAGLVMHRLVQAVIRDRLSMIKPALWSRLCRWRPGRLSPVEVKQRWVATAIAVVEAAFPDEDEVYRPQDIGVWTTCGRLLSHAKVALTHDTVKMAKPMVEGRLLSSVGGYLLAQNCHEEAELFLQRRLGIAEKMLGANHPVTAVSINNLGFLYGLLGRYTEVESLYQRALHIDERVFGANHPRVALRLNNLAALYQGQGRYEEAELLHQRAITIREKALGANHPDIAQSLNNLALLYVSLDRHAEAELLCERTLSGLSNKFFDIFIVPLEFRPSFGL